MYVKDSNAIREGFIAAAMVAQHALMAYPIRFRSIKQSEAWIAENPDAKILHAEIFRRPWPWNVDSDSEPLWFGKLSRTERISRVVLWVN